VSFSYDVATSSCKLGGLQAEYGDGAPGTVSQVYDQGKHKKLPFYLESR